jgi:hypothetical protein
MRAAMRRKQFVILARFLPKPNNTRTLKSGGLHQRMPPIGARCPPAPVVPGFAGPGGGALRPSVPFGRAAIVHEHPVRLHSIIAPFSVQFFAIAEQSAPVFTPAQVHCLVFTSHEKFSAWAVAENANAVAIISSILIRSSSVSVPAMNLPQLLIIELQMSRTQDLFCKSPTSEPPCLLLAAGSTGRRNTLS